MTDKELIDKLYEAVAVLQAEGCQEYAEIVADIALRIWKPTDAQIEALETAERWYSDNMGYDADLFNLLTDLKKLM